MRNIRPKPGFRAEFYKLWDEGMPMKKICKMLGISIGVAQEALGARDRRQRLLETKE